MSTIAAYGHAGLAVLERDLRVFMTYRSRVVGQLMRILLTITLFYYVSRLVSVERFPTPDDYFAFAVVGIVILRSLLSSYGTFASTIRQELVAGTFERMATSPLGGTAGTVAMTLFPFALALLTGALTIVLAAVLFGVPLSWSTLPLAPPLAILAVLAFAPFALALGALTIAFKQPAGAGLFVVFVTFVSGAIFPVELLPGWIRWAADVQPFTPTVDVLRHVIVGTPLEEPLGSALLKITAFVVVLLPLSILSIDRAIEYGRRRATLIEY
jgi:ABC-2 type transport system permease protein